MLKSTPRNIVALAISLGGNLKEVFEQIEESISDEDDSESDRGLQISEDSGREVALPALMHEAIKRDLRLDLPEVSDVLLRETLVPGDPEEAGHPQSLAGGEVLTFYNRTPPSSLFNTLRSAPRPITLITPRVRYS